MACLLFDKIVFNNSIHAHRVNFERDSLLSNITLSKQPMKKLKGCMGLFAPILTHVLWVIVYFILLIFHYTEKL